jgi:predicted DNA-binding transcriptional regulator AlpA
MASRSLAAASRETITMKEVAAMFGVNRLTITRWVAQGRFPRPLQIGKTIKVWSRRTIEDILNAK